MKIKTSIHLLLALLIAVIAFHLFILCKIIPYSITWGGRLQNDSEMYVFESISILINLFLGYVVLMKGRYLKPLIKEKALNVILIVFLVIFALNTIGNLFAKTKFEQSFALLTFIFAVLIWRVLSPATKKVAVAE